MSVYTARPESALDGRRPKPSEPKDWARSQIFPLDPPTLSAAWPHMLLVFCVALAVYGFTAPPTVVLEDDGEFVTAAYFAGVAHPPGYPLYILLSHPFSWLPFGSVAFRIHLSSAVHGAAACAMLWWIARTLIPKTSAAYVGALALAFSRVFWSQAIIAEVYSLNVLLVLLSFGFCLSYLKSRRPSSLLAVIFLFSLSLSNHWPLSVLSLPCLAFSLLPEYKSVLRQIRDRYLAVLCVFAAGLSPYAWMVLRSQSHPELAFYGEIDSWRDFLFYVSRGGYARVDSSPSAGWWDKAQYIGFLSREIFQQYTPVGAIMAGVGFFLQWKYWNSWVVIGLIAAFLGGTIGLVFLLNFDYQFQSRATLEVYPLVPYGLMSLWLALGFHCLTVRLNFLREPISHGIGVVLVVIILVANFPDNNRRKDGFAEDFGLTFLKNFDRNATVFTHADMDAFPLGYLHYVEGVRPDIKLLNDHSFGISLDGRLFPPPLFEPEEVEEILRAYVENSEMPIYFFENPPQPFGQIDYGFFTKIDRLHNGRTTIHVNADLLALYRRMMGERGHKDSWTVRTRDLFTGRMMRVLSTIVYLSPDRDVAEEYRADLEAGFDENFVGLLGSIVVLTNTGRVDLEEMLDFARRAEALLDETVSKSSHALLYLIRGRILVRLGRREEAVAAFARSLEIYPHPTNKASIDLKKLSKEGIPAEVN